VTPLDLMKNWDVSTFVSRYACLDFSQIYGFPNPLPKDGYSLMNGPKFNGEDLSLTLKHISYFRDLTELLRVKHEDVFLRMCHDSFQEKCRSWDDGLLVKSIRYFSVFWVIFLETWMEKTEFTTDYVSIPDFTEWKAMYTDDEVKENFTSLLSSYLKSCKCSSTTKINILEEFAEKLEKDLEALEVQIRSQDFHYQIFYFEYFFQLPLVVNKEEFFDFDHELEIS
jgi:hypothetical protein